jgi:NitT/TauT family transport system substrate-binding protein
MRKIFIFLIVTIISFVIAVLLIKTNISNQVSSPENRIRVGYIPIADCAQLYVGIEKGFFKEEGLDIELVSLAGGAKIIEALATGSIDIGFSNVISLILARASGLRVVAISGGPIEDENHKEHAILVRKDSPIRLPKDLDGKTIAINTRKNIDELFLRIYLEKNGVNPDKVKLVEIPFPNMESVLISGEVDAVASIEPYVTFALLHGQVKVLDYNYIAIEPVVEISAYVASEDWLERNKKIADKFISAFNKATDYALQHEDEVRTIITKYTKLDQKYAQQIVLPSWGKNLTVSQLDKMIQKVYARGWIAKPLDGSSLVLRQK